MTTREIYYANIRRKHGPLALEDVEFPLDEYDDADCYVYFIQESGSGYIKIGSAGNVKQRFSGLQSGNPHELRLVCWIRGDRKKERELHSQFNHFRVRGEWFMCGPSLSEYITRIICPGLFEAA